MNNTPDESAQSKGGKARAEKLTKEERSAIAKGAASARWSLPKATHYGTLNLGGTSIPCFVLEDGRRVISGRGLTSAIGMKGRGQGVARISGHKLVSTEENAALRLAIQKPIKFVGRSPQGDAATSDGYEAIILQEVCEALLTARDKGMAVTEQDKRYVQFADALIRSFAKIGIVALVDEATGYQEVRNREALRALLDAFLRQEFAAWAKRFPDEFYKEIFRLRGWEWDHLSVKRPLLVGKLTNDVVYERLAPGVLAELKNRNPKDEKGRRPQKHHQWLSEDIGNPALAQHLHAVIGFMRASSNWNQFHQLLDLAFPKRGSVIQLELIPG